jgi:hypothetical protein
MFAPRYAYSHAHDLVGTVGWHHYLSPGVRKMAYIGTMRQLAFSATLLSFFSSLGYDIEIDDPTNPAFARIKIGQHSWDHTSGLGQYIRLMAQVGRNIRDLKDIVWRDVLFPSLYDKPWMPTTWDEQEAFNEKKPNVSARVEKEVAQFLEKKGHPVVSLLYKLGSGKNVIGKPVTRTQALLEMYQPISVQNFSDYFENGATAHSTLYLAELAGENLTYIPDEDEMIRMRDEALSRIDSRDIRTFNEVRDQFNNWIEYARKEERGRYKRREERAAGERLRVPTYLDMLKKLGLYSGKSNQPTQNKEK